MTQDEVTYILNNFIKNNDCPDRYLRRLLNENILPFNADPKVTWKQLFYDSGLMAEWNDENESPYIDYGYGTYIYSCRFCHQHSWKRNSGPYGNCQQCVVQVHEPCGTPILSSNLAEHITTCGNNGIGVSPHSPFNPPGTHSTDGLIRSYNDKIDPYLHGKSTFDSKGNDITIDYGIELEVERAEGWPQTLHADILKTLGLKYAMLKRDGSLGNNGANGFEIVTAPATFEWLMTQSHWPQFFSQFEKFLAPNPPTTGLHLHIGINSFTSMDKAKFIKFINNVNNLDFLSWVADRDLSDHEYAIIDETTSPARLLISQKIHQRYCPQYDQKFKRIMLKKQQGQWVTYYQRSNQQIRKDMWGNPLILSFNDPSIIKMIGCCTCRDKQKYNQDRHAALNFNTNLPTIEIRIFKGKMDQDFFFSCIEFTDALICFIKNNGKHDMEWRKFIEWFQQSMRRIYPHFANRVKQALKHHQFDSFSSQAYEHELPINYAEFPTAANAIPWHVMLDAVGVYGNIITQTPATTEFHETVEDF